jgi:hypothetical protein
MVINWLFDNLLNWHPIFFDIDNLTNNQYFNKKKPT